MQTNSTAHCMQCGRCSASCPAAARMDLLPHQWVGRVQSGNAVAVRDAKAIWLCVGCFCCGARCPRGVLPYALAEEARANNPRDAHDPAPLLDTVAARAKTTMPQQLAVAALRKRR